MFVLIVSLILNNSSVSASEPIAVGLDLINKRVASENLLVLQHAVRSYQARQAIHVARGQLLPRLHVWKWSSMLFDIRNAFSIVEDVAPFLVVSNWYRVQEQKYLFASQQSAYHALWANELMQARTIYFQLLLDEKILSLINQEIEELQNIRTMVESREIWGALKPGSVLELDVRILSLEEDRRSLSSMIIETKSQLALLLAIDPKEKIELIPFNNQENFELVFESNESYETMIATALNVAPEVRQYDSLIEVARIMHRALYFTPFAINTLTRGFTGSQFDSIPVQPGAGFGTPGSMRIVKGQENLLKLQKWTIEEVIKKQLKNLILDVELDQANLKNIQTRVQLTKELLNTNYQRITMGENIDMLHLVEASRNHIASVMAQYEVELRFHKHSERKNRLLLQSAYSETPAEVESTASFNEKIEELQKQRGEASEPEKQRKCGLFRKIFSSCEQ